MAADAPLSAIAGLMPFAGAGSRRPPVLQSEAAECGLACLAMVAGHHGQDIDLSALRTRFGVSMKGASLSQLIGAAAALGLSARPLRLEPEILGDLRLPAILHWDMNHFVVLTRVRGRTLWIADPAIGERRISLSEAGRHFTGVALELAPTASFERKTERTRLSLWQMLRHIVGLRGALAQVLALSLVLELCVLLLPYFTQAVVDHVALTADTGLLWTLVLGFSLLLLVQHAVGALRAWVILYLGSTVNLQWQGNTFAHLLRLPVDFFERRHVGDIVSRFESIHEIQRAATAQAVQALVDGLLAVTTLAAMLLYAPALAAVSVAAVLLVALMRVLSLRRVMAANQETIVHGAKQQTHFLETVRGARAIKLFERADQRRTGWLNLLVAQTNAGIVRDRLNILFAEASGLLFGLERVLVIALATLLVLETRFTLGALFAYLTYKDLFAQRVGGLIDRLIEFGMLRVHLDRLAEIVTAEPEDAEPARTDGVVLQSASLSLHNVSYRYGPGEAPVLHEVTLEIADGESVAIVGPSGCGKTTLLKLLAGLTQPQQGEVRVGGLSIRALGLRDFRRMIGTVMQDDQLLAGSIADNICFFDPERDTAWVQECAAMAAIHDDIQAMPMRYDTLIGDMGAAISGGQKQRILLARALYKRPRILLLDEATSHLDVALEQSVNAVIGRLQMTRVIVAHRPETIASADRVFRLGGPSTGPAPVLSTAHVANGPVHDGTSAARRGARPRTRHRA